MASLVAPGAVKDDEPIVGLAAMNARGRGQFRRPGWARRTIMAGWRTAIWRRPRTKDRCPIRAKRRCRVSRKMRALVRMGLIQGVLPPHERPHIASLRKMGFGRTATRMCSRAAPRGITRCCWRTCRLGVGDVDGERRHSLPSADTGDGACASDAGQSFVAPASRRSRRKRRRACSRLIFADDAPFVVHAPVPFARFGDEGAANHCRLSRARHGVRGGAVRSWPLGPGETDRAVSLPRQAIEASHIVATQHRLRLAAVSSLAQQARKAIDGEARFTTMLWPSSNENVLHVPRRRVREAGRAS